MKTHDPLAIANWFLARSEAEGQGLSPMKLQKLIYFAHGWSLALTQVPLIDERPQAWDYGPVIPTVYQHFKEFGGSTITRRAYNLLKRDGTPPKTVREMLNSVLIEAEPKIEDDADAERLLSKIWELYGRYSATQLSNMTHQPGGAWAQAFEASNGRRGIEITDTLIADEFSKKIKADGQQPASAGT